MFKKKLLFYDPLVANCPEEKPGYQCANGWRDFERLGISIIATHSWLYGYRVFFPHEFDQFQELANQAEEVIGFNSIDFGDLLLAANGIKVKTTYDLLCQIRLASSQPEFYVWGKTRKGYSLASLARVNFEVTDLLSAEVAPMIWQNRDSQHLVKRALARITIIRELYRNRSCLLDPTNRQVLKLRGGNWFKYLVTKEQQYFKNLPWRNRYSEISLFLFGVRHGLDVRDCQFHLFPKIDLRINDYEIAIFLSKKFFYFEMPKTTFVYLSLASQDSKDSREKIKWGMAFESDEDNWDDIPF